MASEVGEHRIYQFGPFRLEPVERLLLRESQPVPLTPKAFDVLVYLVERHGRLVDKDTLLSAVWRDAIVEEANLAYNISAIRKALGSDFANSIETVPTRGYRFVASVTVRHPLPRANGDGADRYVTSLPQQLTRFIGRRTQISDVRLALADARLVTLTGPGGIGKTRLALQVAAEAAPEYADGVWFVDFAPISDPPLVPQTLASVLQIHEERGQTLLDTLQLHLSPKSLLVIFDNCEHLIDACAHLADTLLRQCPQLRILATSRESLSIAGEEILLVPPLTLPTADGAVNPQSIADAEAVQLFADRARLVQSTFALCASNLVAVTQICVALEGIPLAIELAASRMRVLSLDQIVTKLHDRLALLTGGSRTAARRHQTLLAAIDWSYNLLSAPEKVLFRRLAVFSGGWTLEAAEAVCGNDGISRSAVLQLLSGLVDKSLVLIDERRLSYRYRFMANILEFAQKCLRESDDAAVLQRRHAEFFTDMAVEGERHLMSPNQQVWLQRLTIEYDNIRAVMNWAGGADVQLALRLAAALGYFWYLRGYWTEGRRWMTDLLELQGTHRHVDLRAHALNPAARLALLQGDHAAARSIVAEALALARRCGDESEAAAALNLGAILEATQGEVGAARRLLEESLAIRRRLGNPAVIATTLNNLGILATFEAEYKAARALYDESLAMFRASDDKRGIAMALVNLGDLLARVGDHGAARPLLEEGLAVARSLEDKALIPAALTTLGDVMCRLGDHEAAGVLSGEALEVSRQVGDKRQVAAALTCLAKVSAHDGDYASAKRFRQESLDLCSRMGMPDGVVESLLGLANIAYLEADHASALALCQRSIGILSAIDDKRQVPRALENIALLLLLQRRTARGASLLGAAQSMREMLASCGPPDDRPDYEHHIELFRGELGAERFTAAWAHGREMTIDQAIACALNEEP